VYQDTYELFLNDKNHFAEAVVNGDIAISQQSWENFRATIDVINQIIEL
jgi:hypothetical protein